MAKKWKDLIASLPAERQEAIAMETRRLAAELPLQELRQARQFTQAALAESLEVGQAEVSKMERRTDLYVSTLRRYIEAMGGELEIVAKFPDGSIRINQFESVI